MYTEINGVVITDVPVLHDDVSLIADHTENTWQANRSYEEKKRDTDIGKKGEAVFQEYVRGWSEVTYIPYDEFRTDGFRNHAPFDGLIFLNEDAGVIDKAKKLVTDNVDAYGRIPSAIRSQLRMNGIYTVEVKTTRLTDRHKRNASGDFDYENIIAEIEKDDYLLYPQYIRNSDEIEDLWDYSCYVTDKTCTGYPFLWLKDSVDMWEEDVLVTEKNNASDLYIRAYIDEKTNQAYLMGYAEGSTIIEEKQIKHMPRVKSEHAIYFTMPISKGMKIEDLKDSFLEFKEYEKSIRDYYPEFDLREHQKPQTLIISRRRNL